GIISLGTTLHQDQQGRQEVDDEHEPEHACIGTTVIFARYARFEVNSFFGNIRIPDQHVLREPQVSPEDRECKHELTQVMQVFLVGIFQVSLVFQVYHKKNDQSNTGYKGAGKSVPAVHGRIPVCIKTHQPQPGHSTHYGQCKPYNEDGSPYRILENISSACIGIGHRIVIGFAGKLTHFVAQHNPQTNGQDGPDNIEAFVQKS